jgi:hypothetical protein
VRHSTYLIEWVLTVILVLQAYLASQDGNTEESPLRTTGSALQTPPASPHRERGSYRILNAQKRNYANLAGAEPRKRRKRQISKPSEKRGEEPTSDQIAYGTIEMGCQNITQQVCLFGHLTLVSRT